MGTTVKLSELIRVLDDVRIADELDCEIQSIVYDSRKATEGSLFVALPGANADGAGYVEDAAQRGAVAVLTESDRSFGAGYPCICVPDAREALAKVATRFYGDPASQLSSVAVTGTNGKTTVSFMLREILMEAQRRPGLIGTVRYEIGDRVLPAKRTTPESPDIQEMMAQMVRSGCCSAVLEVSSHALDQHRVDGIEFDAAIFTNLTQDHLDYHGTLEEYFEVKSRLFSQVSGSAIINADDPWGQRLLNKKSGSVPCVSYGFSEEASVRGSKVKTDASGSRMKIDSPWGKVNLSLKLIGRYNLYNALAAFAAAASMGVDLKTITHALGEMESVPGRLEAIAGKKNKRVFVDYAHTDDALQNVLQALREITPGKLIVVFGCGGSRDQGKRSLMGAVASRLADYSIITNDNPRTEAPGKIVADILEGFDSDRKFEVVLDRRAAILRGVELVGRKDVLLVAGKGHETVQEFDGTIVPFDDREIVREVL